MTSFEVDIQNLCVVGNVIIIIMSDGQIKQKMLIASLKNWSNSSCKSITEGVLATMKQLSEQSMFNKAKN